MEIALRALIDRAWGSRNRSFHSDQTKSNTRASFRTSQAGLVAVSFFGASFPAWAHVGGLHHDDEIWHVWSLTPDLVIPAVLAAAVYVAGFLRRGAQDRTNIWRHLAFASGVVAIFIALASPLDYVAEHLFSVHQIQHLLLRMLGPMLIALAAPQAMLIRGLPSRLRRNALAPIASNGVMRRLFSLLVDPVVVTALFVAALYVWQYPPYHNAALLNEGIHYTMHVTMLLAGLLFWWRIFDRRSAPLALRFGTRLMMLWIVMLSNIALGAYTTVKDELLYPAYDVVGRLFDIAPLTDERVGGFIIWMPSSMMCIVAMIVVIHFWGRHETLLDDRRRRSSPSNSAVMAEPTTGAEMIAQARPGNRVLAIGFGAFAASMFAAAILIGVLSHLNREGPHGLLAHAPFSQPLTHHSLYIPAAMPRPSLT